MNSLFSPRTLQQISRRFSSAAMSADAKFPVSAAITANLSATFDPSHLEVINESHMHNVPKDSETHFKVVVVSAEFEKAKTPLQRHRLVNAALKEQLDGPVHALSIVAKTPAQWQAMVDAGQQVGPSPSCRGGDGSLPPKNG